MVLNLYHLDLILHLQGQVLQFLVLHLCLFFLHRGTLRDMQVVMVGGMSVMYRIAWCMAN